VHRQFKELLTSATATSEFVVVVCVDVRDFSAFSKRVEAPEVGVFIKRFYREAIERFPKAIFFKPAGDGLLIAIPYGEGNLQAVVADTARVCFDLLSDFPAFFEGDPMVNFETPHRLGIGLARGTACRLHSGETTLDYSGSVLNLAARMTDLARPSGIVLHGAYGLDLVDEDLRSRFQSADVYVRGLAERTAMPVHCSEHVTLSPASLRPIGERAWHELETEYTLAQLKKMAPKFGWRLSPPPATDDDVFVRVTHQLISNGRRLQEFGTTTKWSAFKLRREAKEVEVIVQLDKVVALLEESGVKSTWPVRIKIGWPGD
jgi:class 3 adenylate cyclase